MDRDRRLRTLERRSGFVQGAEGCPSLAMGFEVSPGIYEIAGKRYTEEDIRRCFSARQPFVVLDDGPTRAGEKTHGQ